MAEIATPDRDAPPDIRRYFEVALRLKWWVVVLTLSSTALAGLAVRSMTPIYEADASVLIEKAWYASTTQEEVAVETKQDDYYITQDEILRSYSLAQRVVKELNLQDAPEFRGADPPQMLLANLKIEPVPYSRIVHIAFDCDNPKLAADVANTLAKVYIQQNIENQSFMSQSVLRVLNNTASRSDIESLPSVVRSPIINELKVQLNKLEGQWADLSRRYTPKHPRMRQLEAQINATRAQIERETQNVVASERTQLSMRLQINNIRMVDEARVPEKPIRPRPRKYLILGFLFGLFLGGIRVLWGAHLDRSIRTPEDLAGETQLAFLGGVPILGIKAGSPFDLMRALWSDQHAEHSELFRNLRSVISLKTASSSPPYPLLVTSCLRGEGKTFISVNLAAAFAQTGERVLIIDADLRAPTAHKYFHIPPDKGLSSYLSAGTNPELYLFRTGIKNLYMMPAGPGLRNPTEMLTSPRLSALMNWAKGRLHRIIVDTPPIIPTTDALVWMNYVQGAVFVISSGQVSSSIVDQALKKLRSVPATNLVGAVLNKVEKLPASSYYYGYGTRTAKAK